jgi:transcriptional regulator GlxA family with amidase domain
MQYRKQRRLNTVRERLHVTSQDDLTVAAIAREAGFVDLSRLAGDYKQQLFGELPSDTLRSQS